MWKDTAAGWTSPLSQVEKPETSKIVGARFTDAGNGNGKFRMAAWLVLLLAFKI